MARESLKDEAEILKPTTTTASPSSSPSSPPPPLLFKSEENMMKPNQDEDKLIVTRPPLSSLKKKNNSSNNNSSNGGCVNRCCSCHKRVGLTGFRCRCGELFCPWHRYSDTHDCSFDYKAAARAQISKANPVIRAAKIIKI